MNTITIKGNDLQVFDGDHTFEELYDHRIALFIALAREVSKQCVSSIWRSHRHSDGGSCEGWFLLGIGTSKGQQITYHIPGDRWRETNFAETLDKAPEFDGHTSADVLQRLKRMTW